MMIKLCENLTRTITFMYNSCFIARLHSRSFMPPGREWTTLTRSSPGPPHYYVLRRVLNWACH